MDFLKSDGMEGHFRFHRIGEALVDNEFLGSLEDEYFYVGIKKKFTWEGNSWEGNEMTGYFNYRAVGMSRAECLSRLYNKAQCQGMGFLHFDPKPMTLKEAEEIIKYREDNKMGFYFDYLKGRVMKVDLRDGGIVSLVLYDRDNGPDAGVEALTDPNWVG
jgi:hypothetical protein